VLNGVVNEGINCPGVIPRPQLPPLDPLWLYECNKLQIQWEDIQISGMEHIEEFFN